MSRQKVADELQLDRSHGPTEMMIAAFDYHDRYKTAIAKLREIDRILNDPSLDGPDSLDMIEGIVRAALIECGS